MNLGKDTGKWQTAVASKGVDHAGAGGHDADTAKNNAHHRKQDEADSPGLAASCLQVDFDQGSSAGGDYRVDIPDDEKEADLERQSCAQAHQDTHDHDPGSSNAGVRDLFDHMCHRIKTCKSKATLKEAKKPGNTIRPAGSIDEGAEDETRWAEFGCAADKNGDGGGDQATNGPDEGYFRDNWQSSSCEEIEEETEEAIQQEDQEELPLSRCEVGVVHGDDAEQQLTTQNTSRSRQSHPTADIDPSCDP